MKKIVITIDEKEFLKFNEKDLFEYVDIWKKELNMIKRCSPTAGIKIATDGLMLETKKHLLKDKTFSDKEKEEFIIDYLLHISFNRLFLLSQLCEEIEVIENED